MMWLRLSGSLSVRACGHGQRALAPLACVSQPRRSASWYESLSDCSAVHLSEQLLQSVQLSSGLPWWSSIVCTTLCLRTAVTLPLAVYQSHVMAKIEALQKEMAALARQLSYEISVAAQEKGWSQHTCRLHFKRNMRRLVSDLYVRDNCHPLKASVLIWVQLPMWVCVSLALRNMSMRPAAAPLGLTAGGALWFPDLTLPDSTWIMPVSLGIINLVITEIFALRRQESSTLQRWATHFIRGVSVLMIPIAANVPSSMCLYWLSSSSIGLAHNLLLKSPRFRSLCRIPASRSDSPTPYRDIATAFTAKYFK